MALVFIIANSLSGVDNAFNVFDPLLLLFVGMGTYYSTKTERRKKGKEDSRIGQYLFLLMMRLYWIAIFVMPAVIVAVLLFSDAPDKWYYALAVVGFSPLYYILIKLVKRETSAYILWQYNMAIGNYDMLHSRQFRYRTSEADQDFEQLDLKYFRDTKKILLEMLLMIPWMSLMLIPLLMCHLIDW